MLLPLRWAHLPPLPSFNHKHFRDTPGWRLEPAVGLLGSLESESETSPPRTKTASLTDRHHEGHYSKGRLSSLMGLPKCGFLPGLDFFLLAGLNWKQRRQPFSEEFFLLR